MTYDNELAHRIREQLADERGVTEKAMFGGLAFLLEGNMAVGISNGGELMVRVGPDASDEALARPHTRIDKRAPRLHRARHAVANGASCRQRDLRRTRLSEVARLQGCLQRA
jgi:hypothetical protein